MYNGESEQTLPDRPIAPSLHDLQRRKAAAGLAMEGGVKANYVNAMPDTAQSRMSALALIEQRIYRLRHEAEGLELLLNALPRTMPVDADEALWRLLNK